MQINTPDNIGMRSIGVRFVYEHRECSPNGKRQLYYLNIFLHKIKLM